MTARQIIQEIEMLSPEGRREVLASLQDRFKEEKASYKASSAVSYLDSETARPLIKEILTDHADTFRKLAQ